MKIIIKVTNDLITAKLGSYEVSTKADVPEDAREALEFFYDEQIISELLRDLANEIY